MRAPVGAVADHVVRRRLRLGDGVAPVLQREELVAEQRVRGACHVTRDEDVVGDDAPEVEGATAGITGDAPRSRTQPRAGQPFGVAHRPQRDDHDIRLDGALVGQMHRPHPAGRVALQPRHRDAGAQIHPVLGLQVGRDRTDHPAEGAHQRSTGTLRHGDGQAHLPAGRRDLGTGETRADDEHPARPRLQPLVQVGGVVPGPQQADAAQPGLVLLGPGPGADAGRDEQPVVLHLVPVGQPDPLGRQVQTRRRDTEPPLGVDLPAVRQLGVARGRHAQQDGLGQRRPVVRLVRLVTDQGQFAGEALGAQRLGGPQTRQRGTDDDDTAFAPEPVDVVSGHRTPPGRLPCRPARPP